MSSITLSLSLRGRLLSGTQTTLQGALFGNGEPGFTFEPWDITTLYQDRAGTTPVTAAGQSVGLRLDKSKGLALGPELITNGDNEAAVAVAPVDGLTNFTAKVQSADRAQSGAYSAKLTANSTSGSHYWVLKHIAAGETIQVSGWAYVPTGATAGQSLKLVDIFDGSFIPEIVPSAGKYDQWVYFSAIRSAKATAWTLALGQDTAANWAGGSIYVDGLSIKTLAGNHQVAISDAKRGVYGWMPKTGRRNRLLYTSQFDNAAWGKFGPSVTPNTALAPNGSMTADTLTMTGTSDYLLQATSVTLGEITTFSTWIRTVSGSAAIRLLVDSGTPGNVSPDIPVTTAWQRISFTGTITGTGSRNVGLQGQSAGGTVQYYIWNGQFETGWAATADQIVNSQYDITEAGVPTCYYVQADGVDDAYVTPTITPNTDKVQVFAGVRKLSDSVQILIEHSASIPLNAGSFSLNAGNDSGVLGASSIAGYSSGGRGSASISPSLKTQIAQSAPDNAVVAVTHDIAGDLSTIRRNGVFGTNAVADKGNGNFLAYPAYIYGRGGTSFPFNGLDFGHAVRFGPNLDAATIARVEALIARNTPEVTL